jgi:glycine dehydrogenase subunit 2
MAGCRVEEVPTGPSGFLLAEEVRKRANAGTAAIMITNPNTLGLFESEIAEIARVLHAVGAQVYMDGANLNALMGLVRPGEVGVDVQHFNLHKTFSTPHGGGGPGSGPIGVKAHLAPFLPVPRIKKSGDRLAFDYDRPQSIGRMKAFYGQMGMLVRAYAYIVTNGAPGLARITRDAIANANYLRARLEGAFAAAYPGPCMHEVVFSDKIQARRGVSAKAIAKALLDYGFHAPTMYFPLVVPGALMIEPTETETVETLDAFIAAMLDIARRAEESPETLDGSTANTYASRVDEIQAARHPVLRWRG